MKILKAVYLPAIGISIIIFGIYVWSWKQPACLLNIEEGGEVGKLPAGNPVLVEAGVNSPEAIENLDKKWNEFKPDILLIKGKVGFHLPGIMDPVKKFGLAGHARELAALNNTAVYSYSLPEEKIAEKLAGKYPQEQIELTMLLCSYYENIKEGAGSLRDNVIRECINNGRCAGLNRKIRGVRDIDAVWHNDFVNARNWRDTNGLPGYAGEIEREIKDIKRRHYINVINHFIKQNKKVFVVGVQYEPVNTATVK